jgi:hypothetical protein
MQDPAFLVLIGREIVAVNLFLRGIEESGVAVEGIPRIICGFLAKKPDPYTPTEMYPLRFSGHAISTWTPTDVI